MKVLVDTSGWYAYFVERDEFHKAAVDFFDQRPTFITSNMIFEEVMALLHHRQGKRVASLAGVSIRDLCTDNFWYIDHSDDEEVMEFYQNTGRHIDYVDASVAWLAQKLDVSIFTFDERLKKEKIAIVP